MLNDNEWSLVNELTFKMFSISDFDEMCRFVMAFLPLLIPCDAITIFPADPEGYMRTPYVVGIDRDHVNSSQGDLGEIDPKRWIFLSGQNRAFRESDLMPEDFRQGHPYYQRAYASDNIYYGAMVSMAYNRKFMGVLSIYRPKDKEDFSDRDIFVLEALKNHLALRFYWHLYQESPTRQRLPGLVDTFAKNRRLTPQESQILHRLIAGDSNEAICQGLHISYGTLKKHFSNLYKKAAVKSQAELFRQLLQMDDS